MTAADRHLMIVDLLAGRDRVLVSDLSRRFSVSEMTIRRDLEALEKAGALNRVHGGAVPARSRAYEPPFAVRTARQAEAKARIGKATADMLHDGETVILDAGTTSLAVANALRGRRDLRVMVLSIHLADVLAEEPGITVMVGGGEIRPGERSFVGHLAERSFADLSFDTLVLTVGGVDLHAGATEYTLADAAVKRAAVASARRCIAVADATKLGSVAFAQVCPVARLDVLVTDDAASSHDIEAFQQAGVEVVVV